MEIKAIETQYKGYRFRSRLEARWAVFFDALGVEWEYEKEGFDLENGDKYLPDFWLKKPACWVEIKPDFADERELEKAGYLAAQTREYVNLISGNPWPGEFSVTAFLNTYVDDETLKYFDLAINNNEERIFQGLVRGLTPMGYTRDIWRSAHINRGWKITDFYLNQKPYRRQERTLCYCEYHRSLSFGYVLYFQEPCQCCGSMERGEFRPEHKGYCFDFEPKLWEIYCCEDHDLIGNPTITAAFKKARSARFEFGEEG